VKLASSSAAQVTITPFSFWP